MSIQQANEHLTQEVIKLHLLAQTTAEQKQIIKENIIRTGRMANITKIQVDYDRISVALKNLRTSFYIFNWLKKYFRISIMNTFDKIVYK